MNEQTQNQDWNNLLLQNANDLTEWIKSTAEKTGSFISEQTPLFIQEYLNWYFWDNLIAIIIWTIFLVASSIFAILSVKKGKWSCGGPDNFWGVFQIISGVLVLVLIGTFFGITQPSIRECIKVTVAPRVILVEKIKDLIPNK